MIIPDSIWFRIWFPLAILTIAVASTIAWRFTDREKDLLVAGEKVELASIAQAIALDLAAESTDRVPEKNGILALRLDSLAVQAGLALIWYRLDASGVPEILYQYPAGIASLILHEHQEGFVYAEHRVRLTGTVRQNYSGTKLLVARTLDSMAASLDERIRPIILASVLITAFALFVYFMLARWVSRSVREVNRFTTSLLHQNFSGTLEFGHGLREMGQLRDTLNRLRLTLNKQQARNQELTSGLEFQVAKRTQELKTVLERLHLAQRIGRIGNFQYWVKADFLELSANIKEVFGLKNIKIASIGDFLELVSQEYRGQVSHQLQQAFRHRSKLELDVPILLPGQIQTLWTSLIGDFSLDAQSGSLYLAGTIQDITERRKIEDQISRLSLVAKLTTNGVIITNPDQEIVWVNEGMTRLSGYSFEEIIGRTPKMFQSERTSPETRRQIARNLSSNTGVMVEVENVTKFGVPYWIELHIQPFHDGFGKPSGFLAVQVDVTERKRHEQALQSALDKANEVNEIKSRFVSMASHEFRTPLTTIMTSAELLQHQLDGQGEVSRDKVRRYIGRISGEVERLAGLINDVLVLGRQEAGKISFRPVYTDIVALVREMFADRSLISGDERILNIKIQGNVRTLHIDPALIGQVLTNLISNAFKYSKGKPSPVLTLDFQSEKLLIHVRDFGIGIPEADQRHLFETFFRGTNVENIPGTGLGLAIVKQFMDIHQGKIQLVSSETSGTSVTLELVFNVLDHIK